jgi:uncharacterized protein
MSEPVDLSFVEIRKRIKQIELPDVDIVVGIATGGIVPASLLAYKLDMPLALLHINYRDLSNKPLYDTPKILSIGDMPLENQRILLVDDVSVSGKTLQAAQGQLPKDRIITLVMKGTADYVLFPEIAACVNWPWKY